MELHAPVVIEGRLDATVPRPVLHGKVQVFLQEGGRTPLRLYSKHETGVAEDGTFRLQGLPRGNGKIFGLCDGWVSKRTLADAPWQAGAAFLEHLPPAEIEQKLRERGDSSYVPQRIVLPLGSSPFVLQMEPTGALEVHVETPEGAPLENARVSTSPNVSYYGLSNVVPWRDWHGTTDGRGITVIRDLPPGPDIPVSVYHAQYEMKRADRVDYIRAEAHSGEITPITIVLEPRGN